MMLLCQQLSPWKKHIGNILFEHPFTHRKYATTHMKLMFFELFSTLWDLFTWHTYVFSNK